MSLLILKIILLKKSMNEICTGLKERLETDTNTLITVSSRDPALLRLASEMNVELRQLRRERRRFQQGDRELKNAVTNISHDLRTPLTAICGYLELMEQEEKSEKVREYLAAVSGRVDALKALTEELFRYSVILSADEKLALTKINLSGLLEESLAGMYGAFSGRGITPQITVPDEPVFCSGNRDALLRVLNNILGNVLQHSEGDLDITLYDNGKLTFSNTAAALSPIQVGRLFDRFYTVDAARNSSGLGLSIAKHLTEQMGGSIQASYEQPTLTITLQMQKSAEESA